MEAVVYFDPEGIALVPDGVEAICRTTVRVEEHGFQVVAVEGVLLDPGPSGTGAVFVGAVNLPGARYSLGIDLSTPPSLPGAFSTDGGQTFQCRSVQPIMNGNLMIRAVMVEAGAPCFAGAAGFR